MKNELKNNFFVAEDDYWQYFQDFSAFADVLSLTSKSLTPEKKIELFNKFVFLINLELSTYCNRKCSYCPLSIYPRQQEYMSKELFEKIIIQLKEMKYRAGIVLNFFNEPLLDNHLIERIRYIRINLPDVYLLFNSNGDFLTKDLLNELFEAGLNLIIVTLQTNPGKCYIDSDKREEMLKFLHKIGIPEYFEKRTEILEKNITIKATLKPHNQINIYCNNWQTYGNDRGGVLKELSKEVRAIPCTKPFREIFVKYNGVITPCCNIYFNLNPIYGDLYNNSLIDIYFSKNMIDFRKKLFSFGDKSGYCTFCNTPDNAEFKTKAERDFVLKNLK
ncbi:MAG: radical SAM protein [Selenomonadaceae bacterium]|nr:radical SAM protein [Selenomonadaceae bacterium]